MKKTDKFITVITVVAYYGDKPWDGVASLHGTDKSVIMTVAGTANIQLNYHDFVKGDGTMCKLFDEIREEGRLEGEARGIIESGIEFGISENDILERLQKKLNITLQVAQEYFQMFVKEPV